MKPVAVVLDDGCGAKEPGACAVAPEPPPATDSPGTPVMLMMTPEAGAVSVVSLRASCADCTCACADATWAWAAATEFGFTCVWTVRLSRAEVICCAAALMRDCPLIASMFCLVWSFASCVRSWLHCTPLGQSVLTLAWSLAIVVASAWFWALTEATVSL
jgi:hypothetical protein